MQTRITFVLVALSAIASAAAAQETPPTLQTQNTPVAPSLAPTTAPESVAEWYAAIDGAAQGPFSAPDLRARSLAPDTLVWRDGMADWRTLGQVAELHEPVAPPPPVVAEGPPPLPGMPAAAPQPEEPIDTTEYHVAEGGAASAALSRDAVAERLRSGRIDGDTLVWFEGLDGWKPLVETRLAALIDGPVGPGGVAPVAVDATAHMHGTWQGQVRETVEGLSDPVTVDYIYAFGDNGRFTGNGSSMLDLRAHGIAQPIRLEVAMEGSWQAELDGERQVRLTVTGSMRTAAPALDMMETETFEEVTTLEIVDPRTLRDEDGNTLQRVGG